jgi:hypothetical protein
MMQQNSMPIEMIRNILTDQAGGKRISATWAFYSLT